MEEMKNRVPCPGGGGQPAPPVLYVSPNYTETSVAENGPEGGAEACTSPAAVGWGVELCYNFTAGIQDGEVVVADTRYTRPQVAGPAFDHARAAVMLSHEGARLDQVLVTYKSIKDTIRANIEGGAAGPGRFAGLSPEQIKLLKQGYVHEAELHATDRSFYRFLAMEDGIPNFEFVARMRHAAKSATRSRQAWQLVSQLFALSNCAEMPVPAVKLPL